MEKKPGYTPPAANLFNNFKRLSVKLLQQDDKFYWYNAGNPISVTALPQLPPEELPVNPLTRFLGRRGGMEREGGKKGERHTEKSKGRPEKGGGEGKVKKTPKTQLHIAH